MQQPEGFESNDESQVCLLKKSLYGLRQAPRQWNLRFDVYMTEIGYRKSDFDPCVYINNGIYLLLYVDDILIFGSDRLKIDELKEQLKQEFEMKDLGKAKKILGIDIRRPKPHVITLTQGSYLQKVLEKFGMNKSKSVSTPLAQHFKLSMKHAANTEEEKEYINKVPYASCVGSLMYSMVCTRPDLAHSMSVVSRFIANPGAEHWEAVKWIMRYIKGTLNAGLVFRNESQFSEEITGFVDSDFAGNLDSRKSLTGYVFTALGGCISWKSNLQKVVALSSTEAEYMAATEAIKEAIWLRGLTDELGFKSDDITVHCDNQSAIHLMKNPMFHEKSKHIDIKMHFIRDVIHSKQELIKKISTHDNPADIFTKSVTA